MDKDPGKGFVAAKDRKESVINQADGLKHVLEHGLSNAKKGLPKIQKKLNNFEADHQKELGKFDARIAKLGKAKDKASAEHQIEQLKREKQEWVSSKESRRSDLQQAEQGLRGYVRGMEGEHQQPERNRLKNDAEGAAMLAHDKDALGYAQDSVSSAKQAHDSNFGNSEIAGRIIYGKANDRIKVHEDGGHKNQQLWLEQSTNRQFVEDQLGQHVPRYLVRNITPNDAHQLASGQGIIPSTTQGGRNPLQHAQGNNTPDISFTAKPDGRITNAQGQTFNRNGKVEMDAYQVTPDRLLDLRTEKAQKTHGFPHLNDETGGVNQATRDVVRTHEVLVQGEGKTKELSPDVFSRQGNGGKVIIFDIPGQQNTPHNESLIGQLNGHPRSRKGK
jgi:hypothetical protein